MPTPAATSAAHANASALLRGVEAASLKKAPPELSPGNTVRVHQKIVEGSKERVQVFEGVVIAVSGGRGMAGSYTVRRVASGFGVEKVFPLHSPNVLKVEVTRAARVRRAKLYFLRGLKGKAARLKERVLNGVVFDESAAAAEAEKKAAAEEKAEAPAEPSAETPAEEKAEAAAEPAAEEKAEATAEKPAEEKAEATAEKPAEEKAEAAAEKLAEEKTEAPAEKPAEAAAEKSAEATAEKSDAEK